MKFINSQILIALSIYYRDLLTPIVFPTFINMSGSFRHSLVSYVTLLHSELRLGRGQSHIEYIVFT